MELQPRNKTVAPSNTVDTEVLAPMLGQGYRRKALTIRNISTGGQTITVHYEDENGSTGAGYVLLPYDVISESDGEGYECFQGRITAIGSAAGGSLAVVERVATCP